ncbi:MULTISPECIES: TadE/TadG family type IV pilus assembly protein [unclassified Roseitalea]|uniref:TadE family protein n=1 Tax=unclassified Roseitalea TaxID=2639107 RepID=UPI00273ECCB4|nr:MULTISPECIES: TadE/TadG family type IV pilus assembly protein [unclassified Roseitalea]
MRSFILGEREGVAAIEFALLAPAFFMLMIGIFEVSYVVYMSSASQRAVEKTIYDIRTGHVFSTMTADELTADEWYRREICNRVALPNCQERVTISVERYDMNANSVWNSEDAGELSVGASETLMRVQVSFDLPDIVFSDLVFGDAVDTLTAGLTFMTEPY